MTKTVDQEPDRFVLPDAANAMHGWRAGTPLRISFLGFNPLGGGYDGRGLIDAGADRTFTSLDTLGAARLVRQYFDLDGDGRASAADRPPFDLRVTGYSYGGWSALQLLHTLGPLGRSIQVRIGLVDPVCTFRSLATRVVGRVPLPPVAAPVLRRFGIDPARLAVPSAPCGPASGGRVPTVTFAKNVFQTKGLIVRWNGNGPRMPMHPKWFASQPLPGFDNVDVSGEVSEAGGHVEVADKYARAVAEETFGGG
ncbi:MAG TPA: hypothetical protein VF796_29045 [Humisphaera sp.]